MSRYGKRALAAGFAAILLISVGALPALTQTVGPIATITSVTSDANPSPAGQPVVFTATVQALGPNAGLPTGTVEFFAGPSSLGTASLSSRDGAGTASLTARLARGAHPIFARYYGDGSFAFSISAPPLPQRVLGQ
jgi:hypothetical protein